MSPSMVSRVSGHKRCNKEYFKDKYGIELTVYGNREIGDNELKICDKFIAIH